MKKFATKTAAVLLSAALLTAPASAACRGETGADALLKLVLQQCQTGGNLSIDPGLLGSTLSDLLQSNFAGLFQPGNPGNPVAPGNPENPGTGAPGQTPDVPQEPSGDQTFESEVVRLINEQRAQYGLSALAANQELSQVARYKSEDMAAKGYFSHESPTYGSPFQMMQTFGISYRTAGENIAYGQKTPAEVVNAWMNSSSHRANILNASYTQTGVGFCANGSYWTQMFIG